MASMIDKDYLLKHKRKVRFFGIGPDDESWGYAVPEEVIENAPILTPSNEPLTWEEFEAMINKPVYIIELETRSYWALVHQVSDAGVRLTSAIDLHDYGSRGLYGKTWLAYRRPPEEYV